jgi:hypothetical protein
MKPWQGLLFALVSLGAVSAAALGGAGATPSAAPGASAAAAPSTSASASPRAPARVLETSPPPAGETPPPSLAEWQEAEPVALARPLPDRCGARLRREWLRIRCRAPVPMSAALLSGTAGVSFFMIASVTEDARAVEMVMPLRRGDRRIVQLTEAGAGYEGPIGQEALLIVSERWLDGDAGPIVVPAPSPKRGWVRGMRFVEQDAPSLTSTVVVEVRPGSPADQAGIRPGDSVGGDEAGLHALFADTNGIQVSLITFRKRGGGLDTRGLSLPLGHR